MRTGVMALLLILFASLGCPAADIPGPQPSTFVHDFAGVIPDDKKGEIQAKAQRLKDEYKTEIAVVTIDSLQGEESFDYSMRMARSWGIGSKDYDVRGLLILIAVKDRKTAFRTSRHIEGELPDGVTGEISRRMNAHFKNDDFGAGLSLGMDLILERLKVTYEPRPAALKAPESGSGLSWLWLPIVAVPALGLGFVMLRHRSRRRAELARRGATKGGFRSWAAAQDPSPVPKAKPKSQGITRAGSRPAKGRKKSPQRSAGATPHYSYDPSNYGSSSSYDSSSSSYDSGSNYSSDSGSSYSGGSDFGGGGSDSSW